MAFPMFHRVALAGILVLFGVMDASAQDAGRYQGISLTKPNDIGGTALIIDTKTGDVWTWFEGAAGTQSGSGSGIRYEGAAVLGRTPGEIVARQGFGLPVVQRQPAGK